MWKRWLLYFVLAVATIPAVVWLAFGPGVSTPYAIFTWPASSLLSWINAAASDALYETVLSALLWWMGLVIVDNAVVSGRRVLDGPPRQR